MEAVINYQGRAVRTSNLINPRTNTSGVLASFKHDLDGTIKTYALIHPKSFRSDQGESYTNVLVSDYYDVERFSEHIASPNVNTIKALKDNHRFSRFKKALTNDNIIVQRVNYNEPHKFYKNDTYDFQHVVHANYNGTNGLDVSLLGSPEINVLNQPEWGEGFFLNHINAINDITDPVEKEGFAKSIIRSALRINMIVRNIFPILVEAVADSPANSDFVNKLINGEGSNKGLLGIWSDDVLFTETSRPVVEEYLLALKSLYRSCFRNQNYIKSHGESVKTLLLDIIPIQALSTLPLAIKIDFLNDYIKNNRELKERDEGVISRIVGSVNTGNATSFLDFLMIQHEGGKTKFELLYGFVTDSRLANWGWVGQLLSIPLGKGYPNRKVFIFSLYKLWLESRYNFYPTANNNTPVIDNGVRADCFWLIQGEGGGFKYFESIDSNPILEFYTYDAHLYSKDIKYEPARITERTFRIYKLTEITGLIPGFDQLETKNKREIYGDYHLFQPIALVGFNPNRELVIPEFSLIPSFLFYYAKEFDSIKDFDAALSLLIEVGLEIGLFFTTGGMATLRHLRHIKHITKLNKARKGLLAPADEVLVWRGLGSASSTIEVTSSILTSFFSYIDDTSNQDEELAKKLNLFFLVLTFTSLGAGSFSRYKTVSAADDVLKRMDELTAQGTPANLTQETIDVIKAVRNSGDVLFSIFKNRISGYTAAELGETNKLFSTFNTFPVDAQKEFWRHFNKFENINFWKRMNKNDADLTKTWDEIIHLKEARKRIEFLAIYRQIKDNPNLQQHVHLGDTDLQPSSGFTKVVVSGYHNPNQLVPPPPDLGQISWKGNVRNSKPDNPTNGYTMGKIERRINEIDPATNAPWQNTTGSNLKVKTNKNVFWPESYSTQRIDEEMAFAKANMNLSNPKVKTHIGGNTAYIYRGTATDGHIIEILYIGGDHINGTLKSIYPAYF